MVQDNGLPHNYWTCQEKWYDRDCCQCANHLYREVLSKVCPVWKRTWFSWRISVKLNSWDVCTRCVNVYVMKSFLLESMVSFRVLWTKYHSSAKKSSVQQYQLINCLIPKNMYLNEMKYYRENNHRIMIFSLSILLSKHTKKCCSENKWVISSVTKEKDLVDEKQSTTVGQRSICVTAESYCQRATGNRYKIWIWEYLRLM